MNNFLKIVIAGAVATIAQKSLGFSPMSLKGFAFFMFIFVLISLAWHLFFSKKELDEKEKVKKLHQKLILKKYLFAFLKKSTLVIITIILLNSIINFLSFKFNLFDDVFKYRYDTKKAVAITTNNNYQKSFKMGEYYYFLYPYEGKYYLVKQKEKTPKTKLLTRYSRIYMADVYQHLKDEKNFEDILKNISPAVYEEVSTSDMILKPLWFSNSIKNIYWTSDNYERYSKKYKEYSQEQKRLKKQKLYKELTCKDIKNLKSSEIEQTIKDLYKYYAFTKDTRYIISLFDELEKRGEKFKDKKLYMYKMELISFLYLYRTKVKLNDILKKYNMGVIYTFNFWENQPLDIPKQKHSHLRLVFLDKNVRLLLWQEKIKDIEILADRLVLHFKDLDDMQITTFKKEDIKPIGLKLNAMIATIFYMEKKYNEENKR